MANCSSIARNEGRIKMKFYAIRHSCGELVKFGTNGEGSPDYCLFRGNVVMFKRKNDARKLLAGFTIPNSFKIVKFICTETEK